MKISHYLNFPPISILVQETETIKVVVVLTYGFHYILCKTLKTGKKNENVVICL